jgi:uncharacterized protein (TIGR02118 family)
MSGFQVSVAYPREEGFTFDKEYYLSTHMPLVEKHWKKHGLKSYVVSELNEDGPYTYIVVMEFESLQGWRAAAQDPSLKEIMEDVPKFSNLKPVTIYGGIIGQKTL